jgi:predicted transcriptional regulator
MDKILSARVDEAVIYKLNLLAKSMNTTKKAVIEKAIIRYSDQIAREQKIDILEKTCGAWNRKEKPGETVDQVRRAFRKSQERYKR